MIIQNMPKTINMDERFMQEALKEALLAMEKDEVPVGAVIVSGDRIIARSHNMTLTLNDATAHGEMIAITSAEYCLGSQHLQECTLYVSLEPCAMCAAAAGLTRLGRVVFGAEDPKAGFSLLTENLFHPKTRIQKGVLPAECAAILQDFFKRKRKRGGLS